MLELRFGEAVVLADKVFLDKYANDDAKMVAVRAKKEISRYYAFQKGMVDVLCADLDWATVYHRVERMRVVYEGTLHEADVEKKWEELSANKRVLYIVEQQRKLDEMVQGVGRMTARDLEKLLLRVTDIADSNPETKVEKNARDWIEEIQRRLAKFHPQK
jgi:hypothetical protein